MVSSARNQVGSRDCRAGRASRFSRDAKTLMIFRRAGAAIGAGVQDLLEIAKGQGYQVVLPSSLSLEGATSKKCGFTRPAEAGRGCVHVPIKKCAAAAVPHFQCAVPGFGQAGVDCIQFIPVHSVAAP